MVVIDGVFNADASFRRLFPVSFVVVAPDVEDRAARHCDKKFQVFSVEISTGYDQIVIPEHAGSVEIPELFDFLVGQ